ARSHQVADRFVLGLWNHDWRQLCRSMQPCEQQRITPIGLDTIGGLAWNPRRGDHLGGISALAQCSHEPVATRSGLMTNTELRGFTDLRKRLGQRDDAVR